MRLRIKKFDVLWISPILVALLGLVFAYVNIHGMTVAWRYVGKPPTESITKIIGFGSDYRFYVKTETGNIYSIDYQPVHDHPLNDPVEWHKEENEQVSLPTSAIEHPSANFISLPLFRKINQTYEMGFLGLESVIFARFALTEDGSLWLWSYGIGSLSGLLYFLFPIYGLIVGCILGFIIYIVLLSIEWIKKKRSSRSGSAGAVGE